MRVSNILCVVVLLAPTVVAAQFTIRPGQYEYTLDMDLGIPAEGQKAVLDEAGFKNNKRLECITADEVNGDIWKLMAREAEEQNCKPSNVKTTGNKLTFTMTCEEDDIRVTTNNEMTFGVDSFAGVTKGKDNEGHLISSKFSAKRVGECPK